MTIPSSMTRTLPGTEICRPRPVTETYVPTAIRSLGTKHSAVTSGRSDRGAMSAARRWLSSSASCASSSRLSTSVGQFPLPPSRGPSARQTARIVRLCHASNKFPSYLRNSVEAGKWSLSYSKTVKRLQKR